MTKAPAKRVRPTEKDPIAIQLTSDGFEARDISATGAGIIVPRHLEGCPLKSPVNFVIKLPGSEPFRARGRIVHRTKLGEEFLGIEFIHLSQTHAALIARYVERRLGESRQHRVTPAASAPTSQRSPNERPGTSSPATGEGVREMRVRPR
jgi:c-di-GMP-binding flagellar brake protein YcgR